MVDQNFIRLRGKVTQPFYLLSRGNAIRWPQMQQIWAPAQSWTTWGMLAIFFLHGGPQELTCRHWAQWCSIWGSGLSEEAMSATNHWSHGGSTSKNIHTWRGWQFEFWRFQIPALFTPLPILYSVAGNAHKQILLKDATFEKPDVHIKQDSLPSKTMHCSIHEGRCFLFNSMTPERTE